MTTARHVSNLGTRGKPRAQLWKQEDLYRALAFQLLFILSIFIQRLLVIPQALGHLGTRGT